MMAGSPEAELSSRKVTVYRYKEPSRARILTIPGSICGFAVGLYMLYQALRTGNDLWAILWGLFGVGSAVFGVRSGRGGRFKRRFEVGEDGISVFSDRGKISAAWDEVKRVEELNSRVGGKCRLRFETARGDFMAFQALEGFEDFVRTVEQHVGERMVAGEERWRTWGHTCSNCGMRFRGASCGFCEVPL